MSNHSITRLGHMAAFGALLALLAGQAQAQTYIATELKKTSTSQQCKLFFRQNSAALLNAAGSVVGVCDYFAGFALDPFTLRVGTARVNKPVLWRAGASPQVLAPPSKTTFNTMFDPSLSLIDSGDILTGTVYRTNWLGGVEGDLLLDQLPVVWKGGKAALGTPPAGTSGRWRVEAISHGGAQLISTSDGLVVVVNGRGVKLPPLPEQAITMGNLVINDLGQVATGAASSFEVVDTIRLAQNPSAWLWTGEAWKRIEPPIGSTIKWIDAINNRGQVTGAVEPPPVPTEYPETRVEAPRGIRFVWSDQAGATLLPGQVAYRAGGRAAMNEAGQVVGALVDQQGYANVYPRAALWQPGQAAIDLNSITTLPKNALLWYALGINAKGQILAQQGDGVFLSRLFLLTPR
jgi:hypothetical protein